MTVPDRFENRFVTSMRTICRNPGSRVALRRAARRRPEDAITAHRYLATWTGTNPGRHREAVLYQAAAWIALFDNGRTIDQPPFGAALAAAVRRGRSRGIAANTMETRLIAAGRADATTLIYEHIPRLLTMLRSTGNVPDFADLVRDVLAWPDRSAQITKKWMGDYYRSLATAAQRTAAADADDA